MRTVTINNKVYNVPELTFAHSKILEQCGVPLRRLIDPDLAFTICSAFVAIVTNNDIEGADHLLEQHVLGGGTLDEIYGAYVTAVTESGFFKKLLENQEKKTVKKATSKTTKIAE